jgi:hypothetical protein
MKRVTTVFKERPAELVSVPQTTHTCDWCQKEVTDHGEMTYGGSSIGGWYHITRTPKSTALHELQQPREWDFCDFECLSCWVNDSDQRGRR